MSNRRAVNRAERRQASQEMHLIQREFETAPALYTEEEVVAAQQDAIHSISDNRFKTLQRRIQNTEASSEENTAELLELTLDLHELANGVRGLVGDLARARVRAIERDRELGRSIATLDGRVDSILIGLSLAGAHTRRTFDHLLSGYCDACGTRFLESHNCGTSPTRTWSEGRSKGRSITEGSSFTESIGLSDSFTTTENTTETV